MPHLLIIGCGSAGKRHAKNLLALGATLSFFDTRRDRMEEILAETAPSSCYDTLEAALDAEAFDGVVIASPPRFHMTQISRVLESLPRARVFCEKPLSVDVASCEAIRSSVDQIFLSYTYRWWPPIIALKERLAEGAIGTPLHARFVMSAHLEDWHPWERYQDFFMASKEMGGGALLDESHFVDLALWIFGRVKGLSACVTKLSRLEISSDDYVDILLEMEGGVRINLHLDLFGRPHERSITVVGEAGTLIYTYEDNTLRQASGAGRVWEETVFACERNDMFLAAGKEYLAWLADNRAPLTCTARDGLEALKIVDACRRSSAQGLLTP